MRTTLDISDDLLAAARELAEQRGETMGEVVSELIRKALTPQNRLKKRGGFPQLPSKSGARVVTMEFVNKLRDEEDG